MPGPVSVLLMTLAASLQAAEAPSPAAAGSLFDALAACGRIGDDRQRLGCYDRAAGRVVEARRAKDIVVLDRSDVRRSKQSLFGFSLPSLKLFGDGADDAPLKQVAGVVRSVTTLPGGRVRFELEGSGVWESTEEANAPPRTGDAVTVKAGSLGSYVATAPGRRAVRVKRVR